MAKKKVSSTSPQEDTAATKALAHLRAATAGLSLIETTLPGKRVHALANAGRMRSETLLKVLGVYEQNATRLGGNFDTGAVRTALANEDMLEPIAALATHVAKRLNHTLVQSRAETRTRGTAMLEMLRGYVRLPEGNDLAVQVSALAAGPKPRHKRAPKAKGTATAPATKAAQAVVVEPQTPATTSPPAGTAPSAEQTSTPQTQG